jgi:CIC family chloride channel protein
MVDDRASEVTSQWPTVQAATKVPAAPAASPEVIARRLGLLPLSLFALLVGVVTGLGAVAFRGLIGLVHNVSFLGEFSFAYDSSIFTPFDP